MELKFILESLLVSSPKPLSVDELRDILTRAADEEGAPEHVRATRKLPHEKIEATLVELAAEHETAGRSYTLACVAGSWQFVTKPDFGPWLRAFVGVKNRPPKLTQAGLETLAVIAYRQPVTRAEIEQIRGVAVDAVITTLKERGLIVEAGRAELVGRPMQYATSPTFLEYFGLKSLEALPAADELRRIPVQRPEQLVTAEAGATAPAAEQLTLEQAEAPAPGAPAPEPVDAATESTTPAAEPAAPVEDAPPAPEESK